MGRRLQNSNGSTGDTVTGRTVKDTKKEIARHLFPRTTKTKRSTRPIAVVTTFSVEELKVVLEKAKSRKALGPDGIPMEAINEVGKITPSLLLSIYNQLIENQEFLRE